jgi:hypothetical protein
MPKTTLVYHPFPYGGGVWKEPIISPINKPMSNEWQPIETAPKDGTEILAYEKCDYLYSNGEIKPFERIKIVRWNEVMQFNNPEDEYDWMTGSSFDEQINPTHWIPLPKPPK